MSTDSKVQTSGRTVWILNETAIHSVSDTLSLGHPLSIREEFFQMKVRDCVLAEPRGIRITIPGWSHGVCVTSVCVCVCVMGEGGSIRNAESRCNPTDLCD